MQDEYLKTQRVLLRQYRETDFPYLLDLNSDPEVMKYLTNGVPSTRGEVEAGVARTLAYHAKFDGRLGVFTAELLDGNEFIGWFLLRPGKEEPDNTLDLELGYRLKKRFWGYGYATEVSQALIRKSFQDMDARSVFARAMKENAASRKVMENVGMFFEREFFDASFGGGRMAAEYRISKEEWQRQKGR